MILNVLIFVSLFQLLFFIAIKYGFLEFVAVASGIIGLVSFGVPFFLYWLYAPKVYYQVSHKEIKQIDDIFQYEALVSIHFEKGNVLLKNMYLSSNVSMTDRTPITEGWSTYAKRKILGLLHESDRVPTYEIIQDERPFFRNKGTGYFLGFETKEKVNEIVLRVVIDTQNDPFKQILWNVFQPNFNYRQQTTIVIDFNSKETQMGALQRS